MRGPAGAGAQDHHLRLLPLLQADPEAAQAQQPSPLSEGEYLENKIIWTPQNYFNYLKARSSKLFQCFQNPKLFQLLKVPKLFHLP